MQNTSVAAITSGPGLHAFAASLFSVQQITVEPVLNLFTSERDESKASECCFCRIYTRHGSVPISNLQPTCYNTRSPISPHRLLLAPQTLRRSGTWLQRLQSPWSDDRWLDEDKQSRRGLSRAGVQGPITCDYQLICAACHSEPGNKQSGKATRGVQAAQ